MGVNKKKVFFSCRNVQELPRKLCQQCIYRVFFVVMMLPVKLYPEYPGKASLLRDNENIIIMCRYLSKGIRRFLLGNICINFKCLLIIINHMLYKYKHTYRVYYTHFIIASYTYPMIQKFSKTLFFVKMPQNFLQITLKLFTL